MVFYQNEVALSLTIASLPGLVSIYFYFTLDNRKLALGLLFCSTIILRLLMISFDPFLHEWDERFHALVAKNMIEQPFKPMLFTNHIIPFNPYDWAYLHIWVHKQPLFLWQMAISMDLFGIGTFALRLPSAIMSCIIVALIYDMGRKWTKNDAVGFIAAVFSTFAYPTLELVSGRRMLEHNDLAFTFYMTCAFWAFIKYINSDHQRKWAVLIGIFAGLAILNKWLVGLLVFGGWAVYILLTLKEKTKRKILDIFIGAAVTCIIFIPWQWYIMHAFPQEAAIAFEYNRRHITEDLGHHGNAFFHISNLTETYHHGLCVFLLIGIPVALFSKTINRKISVSLIAMIIFLFGFFSLFVATKMPSFVYPVSGLLFILMALGYFSSLQPGFDSFRINKNGRAIILTVTLSILVLFLFKPWQMIDERKSDNEYRNRRIHNNLIFKQMDPSIIQNTVVMNTRGYENIELMFYQGGIAYHYYFPENVLDSLQSEGYRFSAFNYSDHQKLPEYITSDSSIQILDYELK